MKAIAGRILIMPKGNYEANTEYVALDLVFHNGVSWVAKKTAEGIEPTTANSEYWMKMCESTDLTKIEARIEALENQMLSAISLDDIDLSAYAKKTELSTYATKTELGNTNANLNELDNEVSTLSGTVANLNQSVNGLSNKYAVVSFVGKGTANDPNNPASVTFPFAPKVIMLLGWKAGTTSGSVQKDIENGGYKYNQKVIFCDLLTTSYVNDAGFLYNDNISQPMRYAKKSADGKTIYWYAASTDSIVQCNYNGYTYYVLGIG